MHHAAATPDTPVRGTERPAASPLHPARRGGGGGRGAGGDGDAGGRGGGRGGNLNGSPSPRVNDGMREGCGGSAPLSCPRSGAAPASPPLLHSAQHPHCLI